MDRLSGVFTPSMSLPPPSYTSLFAQSENEFTQNTDELDDETAPRFFKIGLRREVAPLVNSAQLIGHLALLRTFGELRAQVDGLGERMKMAVPLMPDDKERRWTWFVGLAVERFTRWCLTMEPNDPGIPIEDMLPPTDVIMVWHSYMLNPGWYTEDTYRLHSLKLLKGVGKSFARSLPRLPIILTSEPSAARVRQWTTRTSRIYDHLEDAVQQETKTILCPKCRSPIHTPLMTAGGQGYLQQNFSTRCPRTTCKKVPTITRSVLAARKLAEDLVRNSSNVNSTLAGTLHKYSGIDQAMQYKDTILTVPRFARPLRATEEGWRVSILDKTMFSLDQMKGIIFAKTRTNDRISIQRVSSAYTDDKIFSVELVGAVLRQECFVKKMHELRWTEPNFFSGEVDAIALKHAIARYHAFLDLIESSSPEFLLVPTLDIDLAWHTHQLMAVKYLADCKLYLGRFVDHNDKVEESRLALAFDATSRAWKDRFNIQYSHCGCPPPGETIGQKLSRLTSFHNGDTSHLIPPLRKDTQAATHPSDHNSVFVYRGPHGYKQGLFLQTRRREKLAKRQKKDLELAKTRELDPQLRERERPHEAAFLIPFPIYSVYDPLLAGCAAGTGSVVNDTDPEFSNL